MKWLDLTKMHARLVLAEDLLGVPYLAMVTSRPLRGAGSALERAGFTKLYHGDYGQFLKDFTASGLLERLQALHSAVPGQTDWRDDVSIADIYPQLHERCQNGTAHAAEVALYDAIRRTLAPQPDDFAPQFVEDDARPIRATGVLGTAGLLAGGDATGDSLELPAGLQQGLLGAHPRAAAPAGGGDRPDAESAAGVGVRAQDIPSGAESFGRDRQLADPTVSERADAAGPQAKTARQPIEAAPEQPLQGAGGAGNEETSEPGATPDREPDRPADIVDELTPEPEGSATPATAPQSPKDAEQQAIDRLIERRAALNRDRPTRTIAGAVNPLTIESRRRHDFGALGLVANLSLERERAERNGESFQPELTEEQLAQLAAFSSTLLAGGLAADQIPAAQAFAAEFLRRARSWASDAIDRPSAVELASYGEDPQRALAADDVRGLVFRHEVFAASRVTDEFARVLWALARRAGYTGGNLLIPNSGTGVLSRQRPADIPTQTTQVPNEPMLFEVASALHPEDAVVSGTYESVVLPGAYYDLAFAVSHHTEDRRTVAEGPQFVFDEAINAEPDTPPLTKAEHLIYKTVQRIRPGGLTFAVVPWAAVDTNTERGRQALAKLARYGEILATTIVPGQLVAGHAQDFVVGRNADNLDAAVASDLPYVLLQIRRRDALLKEDEAVQHVNRVFTNYTQLRATDFDYLDAVREIRQGDAFRALDAMSEDAYRVCYAAAIAAEETRLTGLIPEASLLPPPDDRPAHGRTLVVRPAPVPEGEPAPVEGTFALLDADVGYRQGGEVQPVALPAAERVLLRDLIPVRDLMRRALDFQLASNDDAGLREIQRDLRRAYDAFVAAHGPLSRPATLEIYRRDAFAASLLQLEHYDSEHDTAEPTSFFTDRVVKQQALVERAESAQEALSISMGRYGYVEPRLISSLMQRPWSDLRKDLASEVYLDPLDGRWVTASQYLSGPVRAKLVSARTAQMINPDLFRSNAIALLAAQPPDVSPDEIDVSIGAPWLPVADHHRFICDCLGVNAGDRDTAVRLSYDSLNARYYLKIDEDRCSARQVIEYSTNAVAAEELFEATLNGRSLRVTVEDETAVVPEGKERPRITEHAATAQAHMYQEKIKDEFVRWTVANVHRAERLARIYNWRVNAYRDRTYNGDYLRFELLSPSWVPMPHQRHGVARYIEDGNLLLAHCLGSGKTFTQAACAVEAVRMGLASKPLMTTPKATFAQTAAEIIKAYPTAKVLIVDGLSAKNDAAIRDFVARASMDNWDLILMTHDSCKAIPLSARAQIKVLERAVLECQKERSLRGGNDAAVSRRENILNKRIDKLRTRATMEAASGADQYGFEKLGVDLLIVDEAHLYKNVDVATKMNVLGITTTGSDRARDLQTKIAFVRAFNGNNRAVVFATATPICNSIAELYTMMDYVNPQILRSMNIRHFDAWAATFGKAQALIEQKPAGDGFQIRERFIRFQNVPEMVRAFRMVADLRTDEDLPEIQKLRPTMETELIVSPRDAADRAYLKTLEVRARALEQKPALWDKDSVIVIMGDLQRGMLDLRMIDPTLPDSEQSIARLVAAHSVEIYRQSQDVLGTQFIFCDQGIHGRAFSLYREVRAQLIAAGVPEREIALITDFEKPHERHKLIQRFNNGKYRFLLGSSTKIGIGVNAQRRVVAMHHVDMPLRPDMLAQRIGRGQRPGNMNTHVRNFVYAKDGQTRRFEILQTKVAAIQQAFRNPDRAARRLDEELDVTLENIQVELTNNQGLREKVRLDADLKNLQLLKAAHVKSTAMYRLEAETLRTAIDNANRRMPALQRFVDLCENYKAAFREQRALDEARGATLDGELATAKETAKQAGMALRQFEAEIKEAAQAQRDAARDAARAEARATRDAARLADRERRAQVRAMKAEYAQALLDAGVEVPASQQPAPEGEAEALPLVAENHDASGTDPQGSEREATLSLTEDQQHRLDMLVEEAARASALVKAAQDAVAAWQRREPGFEMRLCTRIDDPESATTLVHDLSQAGDSFNLAAYDRSAMRGRKVLVGVIGPFQVYYQNRPLTSTYGRDLFRSAGEGSAGISEDTEILGLSPQTLGFTGYIALSDGDVELTTHATTHARSNLLRLMRLIDDVDGAFRARTAKITRNEEQLRELCARAETPFARDDELVTMTRRKLELDTLLLQQQARMDHEEELAVMAPMLNAAHASSGRPVHPERLRHWRPAEEHLDEAPVDAQAEPGAPNIEQLREAADQAVAALQPPYRDQGVELRVVNG